MGGTRRTRTDVKWLRRASVLLEIIGCVPSGDGAVLRGGLKLSNDSADECGVEPGGSTGSRMVPGRGEHGLGSITTGCRNDSCSGRSRARFRFPAPPIQRGAQLYTTRAGSDETSESRRLICSYICPLDTRGKDSTSNDCAQTRASGEFDPEVSFRGQGRIRDSPCIHETGSTDTVAP